MQSNVRNLDFEFSLLCKQYCSDLFSTTSLYYISFPKEEMAVLRQTLRVPHLGGTTVGFRSSVSVLNPAKPTLVLVIPFTTTVDYYTPEFENPEITTKLNLIAVEPLGHGATRTNSETFTYWDSALVSLQLLEALGIDRVFAGGTSQGGWVAVQMALLAPQKVKHFSSNKHS